MKHSITFILLLMAIMKLSAQIGINTDTPHASSVLEIDTYNNDKGLLIPRITNAQKLAISSPAPSLMVYDTDLKCISQYKDTPSNPGTYTWTCLTLYNRHFFYMPSVNIPTSDGSGNLLTGVQTLDLYSIYNTGFSVPKIKSAGANNSIPFFEVNQLNYYVTYTDPCITVAAISNTGVLSYTVNSLPNYDAFMNIVFTVR
ncbi:hypothetical protein [Dysgonomonas capnocytophagoides]|uniref:hypothetical protein n=1 Tax=Dysgonomonas capnocytophagoides TaxID=45254 RepID=UPI00333F58B9